MTYFTKIHNLKNYTTHNNINTIKDSNLNIEKQKYIMYI